jgi:hypothetical protein
MDEKTSQFTIIKVLLIILLVSVIGFLLFFAFKINSVINATFTPLHNANNAISTQISSLLNPTPTIIPDPITIIREVQSLARLETIQYTVEKVITAELNQGVLEPFFGDRLLFVAHGYVIAGVDLSKLEAADLRMEDQILVVSLPEAEVFVATLNNENSYVYDRTTGLLRKSDRDLETEARLVAQQEILRGAIEDGILTQARINAEVYLERLLNSLGFDYVHFE